MKDKTARINVWWCIDIYFCSRYVYNINSWFQIRSGQNKDLQNMVIAASPLDTAALMKKSKDWLTRNPDNVSEYSNMSTRIHVLVR